MTWGRRNFLDQIPIDQSSGGTPGIWDVVYLAGQACPGIAEVSLNLGADIDKRRKKGQKKSRAIDCGAKPAELSIDLTLRPSELEPFVSKFVPLLFSLNKTAAQNPIAVGHPSLEIWGLDLFVVQGLSQPHPKGGFLKISIKAVEWVPDPPVISPVQKITTADFQDLGARIAPVAKTVIDRFFNP